MSKSDDNNEYLAVREIERRERFERDNPNMIATIMVADDKPNSNGITYSKEMMKKAFEDLQDQVKNKKLLVYDNLDLSGARNDLRRAGALVTKIEANNDKINANLKFLDTPSGFRLSAYLRNLPDRTKLRTELSIDCSVVGVYAEESTSTHAPI